MFLLQPEVRRPTLKLWTWAPFIVVFEELLKVSLWEWEPDLSSHQSESTTRFLLCCYIYIWNGGLIKAAVLIQRNPKPSCGGRVLRPALRCRLRAPSCCRYHLKLSRYGCSWRNWNGEFGMSCLLTVTLRFSPENSTFHSCPYSLT